jgi:hypothetical protein
MGLSRAKDPVETTGRGGGRIVKTMHFSQPVRLVAAAGRSSSLFEGCFGSLQVIRSARRNFTLSAILKLISLLALTTSKAAQFSRS